MTEGYPTSLITAKSYPVVVKKICNLDYQAESEGRLSRQYNPTKVNMYYKPDKTQVEEKRERIRNFIENSHSFEKEPSSFILTAYIRAFTIYPGGQDYTRLSNNPGLS